MRSRHRDSPLSVPKSREHGRMSNIESSKMCQSHIDVKRQPVKRPPPHVYREEAGAPEPPGAVWQVDREHHSCRDELKVGSYDYDKPAVRCKSRKPSATSPLRSIKSCQASGERHHRSEYRGELFWPGLLWDTRLPCDVTEHRSLEAFETRLEFLFPILRHSPRSIDQLMEGVNSCCGC